MLNHIHGSCAEPMQNVACALIKVDSQYKTRETFKVTSRFPFFFLSALSGEREYNYDLSLAIYLILLY